MRDMGEAKRRGTFEERKAKAILKDKLLKRLTVEKKAKIQAAKTTEQLIEEKKAKREASIFMCHLAALSVPYMKYVLHLRFDMPRKRIL
jgi:hypothetical protein